MTPADCEFEGVAMQAPSCSSALLGQERTYDDAQTVQ
jgi:hypothetical protein